MERSQEKGGPGLEWNSVYSFGENESGQLGDGTRTYRNEFGLVKFPDDKEDSTIISFSCGNDHAVSVTRSPRVLSWGSNEYGQLGNGSSGEGLVEVYPQDIHFEKLNLLEEGEFIERAVCGGEFSLLLSNRGNVFSFGRNRHQQLGVGERFQDTSVISTPTKITFPSSSCKEKEKITISQLACGEGHSLALSSEGKVFGWGNNLFGALGLEKRVENAASPIEVTPRIPLEEEEEGERIIQISASSRASFFLSNRREGNLFSCGDRYENGLGLGFGLGLGLGFRSKNETVCYSPTRLPVEYFSSSPITKVFAHVSSRSIFALDSSKRRVFSWGINHQTLSSKFGEVKKEEGRKRRLRPFPAFVEILEKVPNIAPFSFEVVQVGSTWGGSFLVIKRSLFTPTAFLTKSTARVNYRTTEFRWSPKI